MGTLKFICLLSLSGLLAVSLFTPRQYVQAVEIVDETTTPSTTSIPRSDTAKERIKSRIKAVYDRVKVRIKRRVERLERIITRVDNLITRFEDKGKDVSQAQSALEQARESLKSASATFQEADSNIQELSGSDNPQEILEVVRELVKAAHEQMYNTRTKIVEAIKSLKAQQ